MALVAAVLAWWHLTLNGLGNTYYTAAAVTGSHNIRALFFAAFDPSAIMAIDKPPLGIVAPAMAIRWFGLSSWSVLAPQGAMFIIGALIAHRAFRRWFHPAAANLATAVLVLTPIDVAVARSNNPDELLVLLAIVGLVLLVEAIRHDHLGWVLAAGLCVGLAFTTKQLQAVVAVPASLIALLSLSQGRRTRRLARTASYAGIAAVSSLAWILTVDHFNPGIRPYVANSTNNTEFNLAFGFNGAHRVRQLRHPPSWVPQHGGWATSIGKLLARLLPQRNLFGPSYLTQTSWLLTAALIGGALALATRSRARRITGVLLAWTASQTLVFAYMPGKFSPYYLAPLLPGVAALLASATDTFLFTKRTTPSDQATVRSDTTAMTIITATIAITAAIATRHLNSWTVVAPITLATIAITGFHLQQRIHRPIRTSSTNRTTSGRTCTERTCTERTASALRLIAIASTVALAIGVPARWTFAAITQPQNPVAPNASLQALDAPTVQQQTISRNDAHLLRYASQHRGTAPLVLATPRITDSAQLVITGASPAPLGGFFGTDPYPQLATFTEWINTQQLRWVALPELPPGRRTATLPPATVAKPWGPWVRTHCTATPTAVWGGTDRAAYWQHYRHGPLHSPLALYDCQHGPTHRGTP